jgi:hypothetical protein
MRAHCLFLAFALAAGACGGGQGRPTTPDESGDLEGTPSGARRATAMPQGIDGTRWRWVEAHCTEGPLDLSSRGYAATLRVHEEDGGLTLITDQTFANEQCEHTLVTRAVLPQPGADWQMEEVVRLALPPTRECFARPEEPRPGEVRVTNGRLEVLVQRSHVWCNGLEVRMVYERLPETLLSPDEIVRTYAAYFTLGNADRIAGLFADAGSLLEPFTRTDTGDPYRHDGRERVHRWFTEMFATAPWRAMRITNIDAAEGQGGAVLRTVAWEYMDPRLEEPLNGRTRFTIAAGEIFEAQIELTSAPNERPLEQTGQEGGVAAGASESR